jgi:hypothetical protein
MDEKLRVTVCAVVPDDDRVNFNLSGSRFRKAGALAHLRARAARIHSLINVFHHWSVVTDA